MTVYLDLRNLFDLFCIVQGITTAAVLFWRSEQPANRWLAWLISGLTLQVVDYFLSRSGIYYHNRWLYFLPLFYSWSFGPLLYAYVRTRAGQLVTLPLCLFAPVAAQAVFYLLLMAQPLDVKAWFWIAVHKPYTRWLEYYVAGGMVLFAIYRSRPYVTDRWLNWMLIGLAVFYAVAAVDPLVNQLYTPSGWPRFYLTTLILPIFVYALALVGLLHDRVQKTARSIAMPSVTADQRERVIRAIRQNELYKDPDLTLVSLARFLNETPNVVSRIINAGFGQSFNDFINTYRVEEVKRRIALGDTNRMTMLGLALDAGFSSKTTFNRVFKEQTGFTPKEYQKMSQITLRDDADVGKTEF